MKEYFNSKPCEAVINNSLLTAVRSSGLLAHLKINTFAV
jgi:hypothetical protein